MNIKEFFRKTFPSLFPFKTTPRTYEVLYHLLCRNNSDNKVRVRLWVKDKYVCMVFEMCHILNRTEQVLEPCFNIKRNLTGNVYEAEVLFEGDVLPFVAVSDGGNVELIPDSEEAMERMGVNPKHCIMLRFMPQIQQAKELSALKDAMKGEEIR